MRRLTSSFLLMGSLALAISGFAPALSPIPMAADSAGNHVAAQFRTAWIYDSPEDTFSNAQVTGRKWWQASMHNGPDETGAAIIGLALTLESTLAFDILQADHLVTSGPPAYEWSFGDVPEGSDAGAWVDSLHDSNPVPVTFSPGFDTSRSVDKTEFTEPDTQTLTITLTPREVTEGFSVLVQAEQNDMVSPVITSPASGEGVSLRQEGHSLHIDPTGLQLNATWTVTVTIEVTPKASKVVFTPYVMIGWEGEALTGGSASGDSLSRPLGDPSDEVGTWTWSAEGTYEWHWEERLSKSVVWAYRYGVEGEGSEGAVSTPEEVGNRIDVGFFHEFHHEVPGNTFVNTEVIGKEWWRTNFANWPDETGAPVIRSNVILNTELKFDEVETDKLTRMGPPVYEWYLGDVVEEPERQEWPWDAFVGFYNSPIKFSPGLDLSRSFDKTVFTTPDIQTMTVTLTPREEWVETVSIFVHTDEDDIVNPVIVSISHVGGGKVNIMEDGHRSGIERIPVELNTPLIIIYTLQITPKVARVEYWPYTSILLYHPGVLASGTNSGNSVSYTNEAGTWTWSAEGDYYWQWGAATPDYTVTFRERARQASTPETSQAISWQLIIGIVAGVIIAGSVTYFFVRRRLRKKR